MKKLVEVGQHNAEVESTIEKHEEDLTKPDQTALEPEVVLTEDVQKNDEKEVARESLIEDDIEKEYSSVDEIAPAEEESKKESVVKEASVRKETSREEEEEIKTEIKHSVRLSQEVSTIRARLDTEHNQTQDMKELSFKDSIAVS